MYLKTNASVLRKPKDFFLIVIRKHKEIADNIRKQYTKPQFVIDKRTDVAFKNLHLSKSLKKIRRKVVIVSDILLIFAVSLMILLVLNCSIRISINSGMT